jgi:hypothetical protein
MSRKQIMEPNSQVPATDFSSRGALNIPESATYCGVRCAAIEAAVRDGRLRGRRFGRNVIILKSDLDEFLGALDIIPPHTPRSILKRREARSRRISPVSSSKDDKLQLRPVA